MNGLLLVLIILIAFLLGWAVYRGWFGVTTDDTGSQHRITLMV